ncbi:MAG: MBOAT family O-acyltransferase [Verrucomicrobiota bacterium]
MLFSTPFFVFAFLPVFFALYWFLPFRAVVLLLGSLVFYGWSEPVFLWVFLASAILDWLLGWRIAGTGRERRGALILGIATNLGLLVYAKYTIFAVTNLNVILSATKLHSLAIPSIALPLGVSFIVFEKITYLMDLYRRVSTPAHSLLNYLNYVFLFPKLLAGPIVKYHDIAGQLGSPSHCYEDVRDGLIRFITGLAKKVLIADFLASSADQIFNLPAASLHTSTAWFGLLCFTLQIFFDFSGYSDMAIGMARILGFRLMENFRDPYLATSFTDFWRRWHISLSSWIKEYLYIPLGGSRISLKRSYINLCICFFLSGLWHGAAWNFVIWGCFHGIGLVADRVFWLEWQKRLPRALNIVITFLLVAIGWAFFRCETVERMGAFLGALFGAQATLPDPVLVGRDTVAMLTVGGLYILYPLLPRPKWLAGGSGMLIPKLALSLLLLILSAGWLGMSTFHPFLYFRF